jgi:trehalose 6-phosphate phosphatase
VPLPRARTPDGQAGLAAVAADPAQALFATDYDGTLAPIVDDPATAVPAPGAVAALSRLAGQVGTVAVITGRAAVDAVSLGSLADVPGLIVLGHYGAQRWQAGVLSAPASPPGVQAVREALPGLLAQVGAPDGTAVEDKGTALAVHTRRTADPAAALALLREPLGRLAESAALTVEPGRMVLELRPPGTDKGSALRGLAQERGARSAVFCGDDLGDLTAFAAIRRLRAEGIPGCAVASQSAETPQVAEAADLVVDGPPGIVRLLAALAGALLDPGEHDHVAEASRRPRRGRRVPTAAGREPARSSQRHARRWRRACSGRRSGPGSRRLTEVPPGRWPGSRPTR